MQAQLDAEKAVLKKLEAEYKAALAAINEKVKLFDYDIGQLDAALQTPGLDEKAVARLESMKRSKVYQKQYQEALKGQIGGIVDKLHGDTYSTISEYLNGCYTDGFLGTIYSLHQQGIPLIMPIDQAAVLKSVQLDSKISNGLYTRLGVDSARLKKVITSEITRGVASSMSYADIARNIRNASSAPLSNCYRIARTEGHRIQQASAADARNAAKKKGADVLKQWDATLDGRTRDTHRLLDGQIRETDEPFEANGKKAMEPGSFGDPAEDCNCRCVALTRARWALDEDELKTLKERAEYFGLDKIKSFDEFRGKYIVAAAESKYNSGDKSDSSVFDGIIGKQTGMSKPYKDALNQRYSKGSAGVQKAFNKYVPSDSVADAAFTGTAHFSPVSRKINMDFADDLQNKRGAGTTFFHEHGHYIDFMAAGAENYDCLSTVSQTFGALLQSDFKDYVKAYKKQHNMNAADAYKNISFELLGHNKHSLSDLIDGISKGKCRGMYGHQRSYWTEPGALEKEAFAHMFEASFDSDKYALMKQYFPNALAEFEKMLKGAI